MAYNDGSSEPIKLSQNDFEHYKVVFTDILVSINQLKMEPKPIGEGETCEANTHCMMHGACVL